MLLWLAAFPISSGRGLLKLQGSGLALVQHYGGRWLDNVFVERLWRSLRDEWVDLHAWSDGQEAKDGIGRWRDFCTEGLPPEVGRFVDVIGEVLKYQIFGDAAAGC